MPAAEIPITPITPWMRGVFACGIAIPRLMPVDIFSSRRRMASRISSRQSRRYWVTSRSTSSSKTSSLSSASTRVLMRAGVNRSRSNIATHSPPVVPVASASGTGRVRARGGALHPPLGGFAREGLLAGLPHHVAGIARAVDPREAEAAEEEHGGEHRREPGEHVARCATRTPCCCRR